ncbi:hypothetical protein H6P81_010804 [Aristolochia fimbriata]|uniref:Uncharacterized protein n=1 Tax=Aristolochia fimbriata TaxID=158543 RepID=A0AAV7EQH2_ARIFI|nr:hypothetical protein H6P81_010804 [Aristolochia fimbriata]
MRRRYRLAAARRCSWKLRVEDPELRRRQQDRLWVRPRHRGFGHTLMLIISGENDAPPAPEQRSKQSITAGKAPLMSR